VQSQRVRRRKIILSEEYARGAVLQQRTGVALLKRNAASHWCLRHSCFSFEKTGKAATTVFCQRRQGAPCDPRKDSITRMTQPYRFFAALMTLASLWAPASFAQDVTLRLHHFLAADANVPKHILDVWADRVEADSQGRIAIQRFPSMQLGGAPADLYDQAASGVVDIVWTAAGYTPGRFPRTEVLELPFMTQTAAAASHAFWTLAEETMQEDFDQVKLLGTWVHGPGVLHTADPVATPDDLRGMKLRGPSRPIVQLLEQVGATPVGMPLGQVPEAVSKGVIDGAVMPWEVAPSIRMHELVDHHTEFDGAMIYTLAFVLVMNKDRYNTLPADLKAVIDAASGLAFSVNAGRVQQSYDAPAREIAEDAGNTIITIPEDQVALWRDLSAPVYDRWVADMAGRGIDGQALIDRARALMADFDAAQ
jgi:TRAP-type C4-dicarboxylate transport system substrate-binding protein